MESMRSKILYLISAIEKYDIELAGYIRKDFDIITYSKSYNNSKYFDYVNFYSMINTFYVIHLQKELIHKLLL